MKVEKGLLALVWGMLIVTVAAAGVSAARGDQPAGSLGRPDPVVSQYAGEFICGSVPPGIFGVLGPGDYRTEISVHNANNFPVFIQKKVVPLPPPENTGLPTPRRVLTMGPDTAFHMDCADFLSFFPAGAVCPPASVDNPELCKGYAVVEAATQQQAGTVPTIVPAQLDVTVTTTVTNPATLDTKLNSLLLSRKIVNYPCWSVIAPT